MFAIKFSKPIFYDFKNTRGPSCLAIFKKIADSRSNHRNNRAKKKVNLQIDLF